MTSVRAITEIELPRLRPWRRGKVRELFDLGTELLVVATDRLSAFDVVFAQGIPDKGAILTRLSALWFERLADLVPHHMITADDGEIAQRVGSYPELAGRSMIVRKAEPIPLECVARGYITGSLYEAYRREGRHTLGLDLPEGLRNGDRLPEPIFTPATKSRSGHDVNLTREEARRLVGPELSDRLEALTLALYARAAEEALARGLILADTKFEFGLVDGEIVWIDEALTPDSSRYWPAEDWRPGGEQPSFDKQYVRAYLESIGWDKQPPAPQLPPDVIEATRERYREAFRRLTGRPWTGPGGPAEA